MLVWCVYFSGLKKLVQHGEPYQVNHEYHLQQRLNRVQRKHKAVSAQLQITTEDVEHWSDQIVAAEKELVEEQRTAMTLSGQAPPRALEDRVPTSIQTVESDSSEHEVDGAGIPASRHVSVEVRFKAAHAQLSVTNSSLKTLQARQAVLTKQVSPMPA